MNTQQEDSRAEDSIDLTVYLGLLALTAITVAATRIGEGRLMAVSIALIIASAKASLIAFYYMDLRKERPFMYVALAIGLVAVGILLFGILPDVAFRR